MYRTSQLFMSEAMDCEVLLNILNSGTSKARRGSWLSSQGLCHPLTPPLPPTLPPLAAPSPFLCKGVQVTGAIVHMHTILLPPNLLGLPSTTPHPPNTHTHTLLKSMWHRWQYCRPNASIEYFIFVCNMTNMHDKPPNNRSLKLLLSDLYMADWNLFENQKGFDNM